MIATRPDAEYSMMPWALKELREHWDQSAQDVSRHAVYNLMKPIALADDDATPTGETCRQADQLFDSEIKQAPSYRGYKEHEKRRIFQRLVHAAKRACYHHGCVMYSRDREQPGCTSILLQVIQCALERNLFVHHLSPPGSPKMSRLLPASKLNQITTIDPWEFDPSREQQFVFLRDRDTKQDLPFDDEHPVAQQVQRRLTTVNLINSRHKITYEPFCKWEQSFGGRKQLRPIHYAIFTDDFDQHGRIYTGHYGHQSLRKIERRTIEFKMQRYEWEPCVELDYSGLHTRMAYHLEGIEYRDDPYSLWGDDTTKPMRLLAKKLMNVALNAESRKATLSACSQAMSSKTKTKPGKPAQRKKHGKALEDAKRLYDAYEQTGIKFGDIYDLAMQTHRPIARYFGSDAGVRLMRHDSAIALAILYHFARLGIPCLSCHDSFVVPQSSLTELRRVMRKFYYRQIGFSPIIKQ